jgi:hypothetical protein
MKEVRVVLIDEAILKYQSLKERASESKKEMAILESVRNKADIIKKDIHYGDPVSKKLIPKTYRKKYDIRNYTSHQRDLQRTSQNHPPFQCSHIPPTHQLSFQFCLKCS